MRGLSSSPFPPWGLSSAREQGRGGASLTRGGAGASLQRRWSLWLLTFAPKVFLAGLKRSQARTWQSFGRAGGQGDRDVVGHLPGAASSKEPNKSPKDTPSHVHPPLALTFPSSLGTVPTSTACSQQRQEISLPKRDLLLPGNPRRGSRSVP